jgi:hypothetical protein
MEKSIQAVCAEADFVNSPFCQCCVPNGYYSISDSCQCTQLILDTDFCWYDGSEAGYPAVSNALAFASNVCQDRAISVPYVDVNTSVSPNHVVDDTDTGVPDAPSVEGGSPDAGGDGSQGNQDGSGESGGLDGASADSAPD